MPRVRVPTMIVLGRADAKKELERSLQLKPAFFDANLMLGQIYLTVDKKAAAALPYLRKAASARPTARQPHALLADALSQLGRSESASRERALAAKATASGP